MQQIIKRKTNVDWLIYKMGHKLIFVFQSASVFIQFTVKTSVFIHLLIFKRSSVYLFMYQLAKVKMKKENNMNKYILK